MKAGSFALRTFPAADDSPALRFEKIVYLASEHRVYDEELGEYVVLPPLITWEQARELLEMTAAKDKP